MISLNFPSFDIKIEERDKKKYVKDLLRHKLLVLTPEEWVRQHVLNYLINILKYPKSMVKAENGLRVNMLLKRTDIVVYDSFGKSWLMVECKSFRVQINNDALQQLAVYNSSMQSKYLVLTNGLNHWCFELDYIKKKMIPLKGFPAYERDQ